jgi:hypothetical protein
MTDEKIKPVAWYDDDLEIHYGPTQPVFTITGWKPLYPESALTQAREEGRREGMREAAEICRQRSAKCSSFGASYHAISCDGDAEAITRAAEGK